MNRFFKLQLWITGLISLVVCSSLWAKPLIPVSQLTISAQDQSVLRAALPQDTESVVTWVWQGNPLSLNLPLHQEYRLLFPEPVQVDINGQLTTDQLRIINDHQTVYFTALQAFKKTARLYITLKNSGRIIFLDVNTMSKNQKEVTAAKVIRVELAPNLKPVHHTQSNFQSPPLEEVVTNSIGNISALDTPFFSASADDLVQASRFAWQQLYAPAYTFSNETGFMRSPMQTSFWASGLLYSDSVLAHPVAAWARDQIFITVVELRNPYPHPHSVDLVHDLCGHWRAAMLYPRTLLQAIGRKPEDSTTLFLISSEPFDRIYSAGGCDHGRA